jgi:APA family basic amino acid/polyamine antiporter
MDALIAMAFAFSGFESAMIPGGGIKNPRENAPRAAFGALLVTSVLYFSLHLVVMRAVPDMASSERSLSDAAAIYFGGAGQTLMATAAVISTLGSLSAAALSAPRLTESMANDRVFPRLLAWKHPKSKTPWVSIVLWALLVIALAIYGTFFWNVVLSVAARLVVYSTMCFSVLKLGKSYGPSLREVRGSFRERCGIALVRPCHVGNHGEHY